MSTKVVFLTGGVCSSLGKGLTLANIGRIFEEIGFKVSVLKFDPYLNINAGKLCPTEHGEVYVTKEGQETDLDLGHYERFELSRLSCVTSGALFQRLLDKQKTSEFKGQTVQIVPHFTNEIHNTIYSVLEKEPDSDFLFVEIGGTAGDNESSPFLEAASRFKGKYGKENVLFIHTSPIVYLSVAEEYKTKPTQHTLQVLGIRGIVPDILILRSSTKPKSAVGAKISFTTSIDEKDIFICLDKNSYLIAEDLYEQKIHEAILNKLNVPIPTKGLENWKEKTKKVTAWKEKKLKVALASKYSFIDAYLSIFKSLKLASYELGIDVEIDYLNVEKISDVSVLEKYGAICVPCDFEIGSIEGRLKTIEYCRTNKVPFLGINLGMQLACIEYARNVLEKTDADSVELNPNTEFPLISALTNEEVKLGNGKVRIMPNTKTHEIFGSETTEGRHRHRYHLNEEFLNIFDNTDLVISAFSDDEEKVAEIIELRDHPFFMATQFHPEFGSSLKYVSPLFIEFLKSAVVNLDNGQ